MNIIRDVSLLPFHIEMDEHNYIVCRDYTAQTGKNKGNVRTTRLAFCNTLSRAVERIVKEKCIAKEGETDLNGFLTEYKSAKQEILDRLDLTKDR